MKQLMAKLLKRPPPAGEDTQTQAAAEAAPKPKRLSGVTVGHFGLFYAVVAVVVLAGAAASAVFQYSQGLQIRTQQAQAAQAARHAGRVGDRLKGYRDLMAVAVTDPVVSAAVAGTGDRVAAAAAVAARFPAAVGARLLRGRPREPDAGPGLPLGYAGIDLVRRVYEQGRPPPVETHGVGSDGAYIALAEPVRDGADGPVLGVLLLGLDPALLDRWLRVGKGYAELVQGGRDGVRLAAAGKTALRGAGEAVEQRVPGTVWQLRFWPPDDPLLARGEWLSLGTVGLAALAALVAGFSGITLVLRGRLRRDLVELVRHTEGLLRGQRQHSFSVRLLEVKQATVDLEQVVEQARRPRVSKPAQAPDQGAGGEPAPSETLFLDPHGVSVEEVEHEHGAGEGPAEGKPEQ